MSDYISQQVYFEVLVTKALAGGFFDYKFILNRSIFTQSVFGNKEALWLNAIRKDISLKLLTNC